MSIPIETRNPIGIAVAVCQAANYSHVALAACDDHVLACWHIAAETNEAVLIAERIDEAIDR